jgi:hypothetical protein
MDKIMALYYSYPKKQSEINNCANALEMEILRTGCILGIFWIASSIKALWCNYAALYRHFT